MGLEVVVLEAVLVGAAVDEVLRRCEAVEVVNGV